MLNNQRWLLLIVLGAALFGCDAVEREEVALTEKLLADAGFQNFAADSVPSDHLAGLPPREMLARSEGGKTVYLYYDIENCHCLYVGSPDAYARYQESVKNEEMARAMTWNDY